MEIHIRPVVPAEASIWEKLRCELWPDGAAEHRGEIAAFFAGTLDEPDAVLVAEDPARNIVAFAELSIRTDLPGLQGVRAGYVEGLYVIPALRRSGVTRKLLQASRDWARRQDCGAFASDRAERIILDQSF
ncbi:MAG TPA: GNAT family N-acetyltransferase [Methylomirabilota bacterium]|jgi:aminoglycoside 6'-N-acetyltransferase I|nr:GNAT family N-acetyltransferase [Methylomirabilota bacterium]